MNHIKSVAMTIAGKTLSDKFTLQTYDDAEIDQIVTVVIKDFHYTFKASEIANNNKLQSITGIYDIDDILNKGVHQLFNPPINATDVTASKTMEALAKVLGKTLNMNITDFSPAAFPTTPTGKELISALFGWTDKIPQRQINVFIRGNEINVLERGKESGTVEVINYTNVTINKKKIRTLQDPFDVAGIEIKGALVGKTPQQDPPTGANYLSGIFTNGDSSITYANGLVIKESHTVKGVEEVTTYSYSSSIPPAYLIIKNTITADARVTVTYSYDNEKLIKEIEEEYKNDKLERKRITRHYPLGQGMWGTSIEEDDITTYGGISQGAPGGKASAYNIAKESINPNALKNNREPPIYMVPGHPYVKYLGAWPVTDLASMMRIANEVIWLDKKTEYRVMLDAYADTIFDLFNRIVWLGNEYFLESNTVTVDPDKTVQRLELIRWA